MKAKTDLLTMLKEKALSLHELIVFDHDILREMVEDVGKRFFDATMQEIPETEEGQTKYLHHILANFGSEIESFAYQNNLEGRVRALVNEIPNHEVMDYYLQAEKSYHCRKPDSLADVDNSPTAYMLETVYLTWWEQTVGDPILAAYQIEGEYFLAGS